MVVSAPLHSLLAILPWRLYQWCRVHASKYIGKVFVCFKTECSSWSNFHWNHIACLWINPLESCWVSFQGGEFSDSNDACSVWRCSSKCLLHLVFLKTWSECILHFPFRHFKGSDCISYVNDILQIDFFLKDWTTPMSPFPPLILCPQVFTKHILSLETRQTHNFLHDFTKRCIQQSVSSLANIIPSVKILHFSGSLLPLSCLSCMVLDCVENEYLHSINVSIIFYWFCFPLSYHILRCAFFQ